MKAEVNLDCNLEVGTMKLIAGQQNQCDKNTILVALLI